MKMFNKKRLKISLCLSFLIILLIALMQLNLFTESRYESIMTTSDAINTAIYLLNDEYQTVPVKLPDIIPSNNQYTYTFSVSNYNSDAHSDTNLRYRIHIRTTTNMEIEYDLFKTLNIANANSCIITDEVIQDEYDTYFNSMYTGYTTFYYNQNNIDYYTILFTFPAENNDYIYSGFADYIEINVESNQILSTD